MEIVDPHHHLWHDRGMGEYLLADLHADTAMVPEIVQTVFVECGSEYRTEGPAHLRPVGETEFVAAIAEASESAAGATIAGIVASTDLRLPPGVLDEVLDAHAVAAGGRFRGIRHALCRATDDVRDSLMIPGRAPVALGADPDFRRGVRRLGVRGLTYDTWHYHVQNREFLDLARAVPETTMVLDHFGTPLGVGPWAGRHDEIFATWTDDIRDLAGCPNVVLKLGGLAMPDNGFGWHVDESSRPDVATFVAAQRRWYDHAIESFGPERCMFESNFPVDKFSLDFATYWDAMRVIAEPYDVDEQHALFAGTARRVYRL
ncbi:amidohydrolase family protein [Actinospongicola halichondriae]|uniref:amidohydrolase family protein n=1 Tax=Actinospongicola halichondriae TaxID=3236844 RepID=UPI003D452BD3